jgi:hypothetical protein
VAASRADSPPAPRQPFADSVRGVAASPTPGSGASSRAVVARTVLTGDERASLMTFEVALRMRNFSELQGRVAQGEQVSRGEMQQKYFPLAADHERVRQWLVGQGLEVTRTDDNHLAIFGRGTVDAVSRAFQVTFARVAKGEAEFTSAVTAPSLPSDIAPAVLGVHGLQPHIRPHPLSNLRRLHPNAGAGGVSYMPSQISAAYNANGLGVTGAGQVIALYELGYPQASDLTAFWADSGIAQSSNNIQRVDIAGGPGSSTSQASLQEATLDAEWSSALAPGAVVRIYGANENDPAANDEILQQVYADLPTQPGLHQLSISIGNTELEVDHDYLVIEAQYMASLASGGVSILSASGDTGAFSQGATDLGEPNANVLQVTTPTSDPSVTGVGGTTLVLNSGGAVSSETAWSGSGGGTSAVFSRPAWQVGTGVPAGTMRLVPDVASSADPDAGAFVVVSGKQSVIGGTSWAAPTWAAFCALINQARASAGQPVIGLLNTRLYSLMGTPAIRDITSGNNGTFSAGVGYDLCTGVGVPDVANLLTASLSPATAPAITSQLGGQVVTLGQPATFLVTVVGAPPFAYQWQRMPNGSQSWGNLGDNATYGGTATSTLVVSGTTAAMGGDQFRCVVSNGSGSATSSPAPLSVNASGVTTLAGWPGSGGSANGTGRAARFDFPGSVRVDPSDNVYVADSFNNTIRKVTPGGVVTTVAGTAGMSGSTDGAATVALFNGPAGVAFDAAGNLYIADDGNNAIRKVTPAGQVSTLAGLAGSPGHVDGTGGAARFSDPQNLAADSAGNLYVADGNGNTIRKVTPAGVVSTLAGSGTAGSADGTGGAAQFNDPTGIAVDGSGNVYVADNGNDTVREVTPSGAVTTLAGRAGSAGNADGAGAGALFNGPSGVTVDTLGNLYVTDSLNDTLREISPTGAVVTIAGSAGIQENIDGPPAESAFASPGDLTVDGSGILFVADSENDTIRRVVPGAPMAPSIVTAPQSQTAAAGSSVTFSASVDATGPVGYQWNFNGAPIAGATGPTFVIADVQPSNAGSYSVTVANAEGAVTSAAALLTVGAGAAPAGPSASVRLVNISTRAGVGTGGNILIPGFVIGGSGTETVLIRADGPALSAFGVTGVLAQPSLSVFDSAGVVVASNTGWGTNANPAQLESAAASVGAFALASGSADCALLASLPAGAYTVQVSGVNNTTGVALAEVYEVSAVGTRLVNISTRAQVGTGANIIIPGFVIAGGGSEALLARADGPVLAAFGVSGFLAQPSLSVFDSTGTAIAANTGWGTGSNPAQVATSAASVGAFALPSGSADSALIVNLSAGAYTLQVSGVNATTGVALAEVYEVP